MKNYVIMTVAVAMLCADSVSADDDGGEAAAKAAWYANQREINAKEKAAESYAFGQNVAVHMVNLGDRYFGELTQDYVLRVTNPCGYTTVCQTIEYIFDNNDHTLSLIKAAMPVWVNEKAFLAGVARIFRAKTGSRGIKFAKTLKGKPASGINFTAGRVVATIYKVPRPVELFYLVR